MIELNKLAEIGNRLKLIDDKIGLYDIPRTNFSTIIENEKLLAIYHKDWLKILRQINFIRSVKNDFLRDYESNPDVAIGRIKAHLDELTELMKAFDSKEMPKLERALKTLSRLEIVELNKCIEDLNRWANYRLTNRIDFFVERIVLYLKGGKSKFDGAEFLGLYTNFKDVELKDAILKSAPAKKLLFYKKEQEFFSKARDSILRSRREGRWEEFYDFYNNLKRGRNYISMVKETFGNEYFANLLESFIRQLHEDPTVWAEELKELSYRLEDTGYQNRYVIHPAVNALLEIFESAKNRILQSHKGFEEVKSILERLEDNIKKEIVKLRKNIKKLKDEFDKVDIEVVDEMAKVIPILIDLMIKVGKAPEYRLGRINQTVNSYESSIDKLKSIVNREFSKPVVPIGGAAFFAAVKADDLARREFQLLTAPLANPTFESYLTQLEQRVDRVTIPKLQRVVSFIRNNEREFKIPISSTKQLLPEVRGLISTFQNDLIAQLRAEGIDLNKPLYG